MPSLIRLVQCLISLPFCQTMRKEYQLLSVPPPAPLDGIGWCTHEVITPWPRMTKPYSVGSGYRTSPADCDDPVHGRVLAIVFRHMSVVQRGVRSRELPPPQPETAWVMSHP